MVGWSWVLNFANAIVGVGVLAMPYCYQQCGILLASLMTLTSAYVTKQTCEFLLRSASYTRKSSYEQIAFHVYGKVGKLITEIGVIGLILGTLVAFQVVIGDLAPAIIHNMLGVQESWLLRAILMIGSSGLIIPLCLMRNISSLASLNAISMGFYMSFVLITVCMSLPSIYLFDWWSSINLWRPAAFFHCLPIISLAFSSQTQVLVMYSSLPDPNMKAMVDIINRAINLVAGIYIIVGTFGYLAFHKTVVHGDVLENFPHGFLTDGMKSGFWLSIIVSFPLLIFPVRAAMNSLLFANKRQGVLHDVISSASDYIAPEKFNYITIGLVCGTLVTGILIPRIEIVLSITGALVGTFMCFVFPSALFLLAGAKDKIRKLAQFILVVSSISMVVCTMTVISGVQHSEPHPAHDAHLVPTHAAGANNHPIKTEFRNPDIQKTQKKIDQGGINIDQGGVNIDQGGANIPSNVQPQEVVPEKQKVERPKSGDSARPVTPVKPVKALEERKLDVGLPKTENLIKQGQSDFKVQMLTVKQPESVDKSAVGKIQLRHQLSNSHEGENMDDKISDLKKVNIEKQLVKDADSANKNNKESDLVADNAELPSVNNEIVKHFNEKKALAVDENDKEMEIVKQNPVDDKKAKSRNKTENEVKFEDKENQGKRGNRDILSNA